MEKQKIFSIIHITLIAVSLLTFMLFFFLQMRKQFSATAFINYWLIFTLAISNIFVFYHQCKRIFPKKSENKQSFSAHIEVIIAWILILLLLVAASLLCWHDYFLNTFIPTITNPDMHLKYLIKLSIPTAGVLVLLAILVVPQIVFLCRRLIRYCQSK